MPKEENNKRAAKAAKRRAAVADAILGLRDALAAAAPPSGRWDAAHASELREAIARRLDGDGDGGDEGGKGGGPEQQLRSLGVLLGFLLSPPPPSAEPAQERPHHAAVVAEDEEDAPEPKRRRRRSRRRAEEEADGVEGGAAAAAAAAAAPLAAAAPALAAKAAVSPRRRPEEAEPRTALSAALRAFGVVDEEAAAAQRQAGGGGAPRPPHWASSVCVAMERARVQGPELAAPPGGVLELYKALAALDGGDGSGRLLLMPLPASAPDAAPTVALPCLWLPHHCGDDDDDDDDDNTAVPGRFYMWDELCARDPSRGLLEALHRAPPRQQRGRRQRAVEAAWPALARAGLLAVGAEDGADDDDDASEDASSSSSGSSSSSDDEDDDEGGGTTTALTTTPKPLRRHPSPRALCAAIALAAASPGALRYVLPRDSAVDPDAARWACVSGALAALGAALLARRQRQPDAPLLPPWVRALSRTLVEHHALRADNGGHWVALSQRPYCDWPPPAAAAEDEEEEEGAVAAQPQRARQLLQGAPGVHLVRPAPPVAERDDDDGGENSSSSYCAALALAAVGVVPLAAAAFPVMVAAAAPSSAKTGASGANGAMAHNPSRPTAWPLAAGAISRALPTLQAAFERRLGPDLSGQLWRRALEPALQRLAVCSSPADAALLLPARLAVPVAQGPPALSPANELLACPVILDGGRLLLAQAEASADGGGGGGGGGEGRGERSLRLPTAAARELLRLALRSAALLPQPPASSSSSSSSSFATPYALPPTTAGAPLLLLDFGAIADELGAAIERAANAAAAGGGAAAAAAEAGGSAAEGGRWALPFAPLLPEARTDGAGLGLQPPQQPQQQQQQQQQQPSPKREQEAGRPTAPSPPPPPPPPFSPYDPLRRAFSRPAASQAVRPLLAAPLPPGGGGAGGARAGAAAAVEERTRELPPRLEGRFRWQDTSSVAAAAARGALREFLVGARVLRAANEEAGLPSGLGAIPGAGGGGAATTTARDRNASVGRWGELVALHHLRERLAEAGGGGGGGGGGLGAPFGEDLEVAWCNARGEAGLPYDLVVRPRGRRSPAGGGGGGGGGQGEDQDDERHWHYVEVKASASPDKVTFEVSWREMAFAASKGARYSVVRVFGAAGGGAGAGGQPVRLLHARDPVALWAQGALAVCMVV
jgi:hypothetical protein